MSPYETLEVEPDVSQEEIKRAYRRKSRETHPDAGGDVEEFKQVNEAYEMIATEERRRYYDEHGEAGTTNPQDALEREMAQLLVMAFEKARSNPISDIRGAIDQEKNQWRSSIEESKSVSKKIRDRLKRLEESNRPSDKVKFVKDILAGRLGMLHRDMKEAERKMECCDRKLEFLEGLEYPSEKEETVGPWEVNNAFIKMKYVVQDTGE